MEHPLSEQWVLAERAAAAEKAAAIEDALAHLANVSGFLPEAARGEVARTSARLREIRNDLAVLAADDDPGGEPRARLVEVVR